jgi:protein tyrosine/serine phosphatase
VWQTLAAVEETHGKIGIHQTKACGNHRLPWHWYALRHLRGLLRHSGCQRNFHAVKAGQLYRSAQLDKVEFGKVIESYHIRSVLNLRGPNPESAWYKDELAAMREHAVDHYVIAHA